MYHLICDGKNLESCESFDDARILARNLSKTGGNVSWKGVTNGRIISIWSGSVVHDRYPYAVTKHISYSCGFVR